MGELAHLKALDTEEFVTRIKAMVPKSIAIGSRVVVEEAIVGDALDEMDESLCDLYNLLLDLPDTDVGAEIKEQLRDLYALQLYLGVALNVLMES